MEPNAERIVIAGGSGFLGVSLAESLLANGFQVTILSRHAPPIAGAWEHVSWDGRSLGDWKAALDGAAGLVNLAGRTVDCIKTPDHQDEILRSRVESTMVLGQAMRSIDRPPPVWVQMGTAHIYGDPPQVVCNEDSPFGVGLAPTVGKAWEQAFHEAVLPQQRGVILRTSFVLGRDRGAGGGALARLRTITRLGLSGRVAAGTQGMSWLHEEDMNALFLRGLQDETMQGAYIASSPHPVSQIEFMRTLRAALGMPLGLPAAAWMVRIGAKLFLRTDPDLVLYGRYVVSRRLAEMDYSFRFPHLKEAFEDLLRQK